MGQSSSAHRAISDSRVVKTKYGKVLGRRFEFEGKQVSRCDPSTLISKFYSKIISRLTLKRFEVDAFQGVPYASPPLGELRFKVS